MTTRNKTRKGAAIAAVAAMTPGVGWVLPDPAEAREAAPQRQQQAAPGNVDSAELYTRAVDVDIAEARRRLDSQDDLNDALGQLRALAGDRFAGAWIEHEPDYRGVVRLTGPVGDRAAFDAVVAASPVPVDVRTDAPMSLADLEAERALVQEELKRTLPGAATGIHEQSGSINVYVPPSTQVGGQAGRQAPDAAMPGVQALTDAPLRVRYEEGGFGAQHDYGGDRMSGCTTGFTVVHHPTGEQGIVSAGHCGDGQNIVGYNGETYPLTRVAWEWSWVTDLAVYTSTHETIPREFYTSPTNRLTLDAAQPYIPWSSQTVGTLVCHHGSASGNSCGFIVDRATTTCDQWPVGSVDVCDPNWVRVEGPFTLACTLGDSGGPWYDNINGVQAFGIHHGGWYNGTGTNPGDCIAALYAPIDFKTSQLGTTLLLG